MSAKFRTRIAGSAAPAPFNHYESLLEVPSGRDPRQNAWLTINLKVKLNFVDKKNPGDNTVHQDGKWYAKDADGYLFPLLTWGDGWRNRFTTLFQRHAEKVWNYRFLLTTPKTYAGLDYSSPLKRGMIIRPNVLCLFRLNLVSTGADRTIDVVNLDYAPGAVKPADPKSKDKPFDVKKFDAGTFRSDSTHYDDADLFRPYMWDKDKKIWHDTIGHEIGHALGQSHILGLKGDKKCAIGTKTGNEARCYGSGADSDNIMGAGDRLSPLNAISWRERIELHSGVKAPHWHVTTATATPPRVHAPSHKPGPLVF
ncbi:MAG TPA: hypothetical protein VNH46_13070 [Gemmatimonadales bacterium]|nr:hypothetical protein [Gemmatimonadales bacterium]